MDISCHDIITPLEQESGGVYIVALYNTSLELESGGVYIVAMARYNHSHGTREWGWIYRGTI